MSMLPPTSIPFSKVLTTRAVRMEDRTPAAHLSDPVVRIATNTQVFQTHKSVAEKIVGPQKEGFWKDLIDHSREMFLDVEGSDFSNMLKYAKYGKVNVNPNNSWEMDSLASACYAVGYKEMGFACKSRMMDNTGLTPSTLPRLPPTQEEVCVGVSGYAAYPKILQKHHTVPVHTTNMSESIVGVPARREPYTLQVRDSVVSVASKRETRTREDDCVHEDTASDAGTEVDPNSEEPEVVDLGERKVDITVDFDN